MCLQKNARRGPYHSNTSRQLAAPPHSLHLATRLGALLLVVLLATTPSFATDPEEIDPDPNFASQEIVVQDRAQIASLDLPPGRYTIRILAADGSEETYELIVTP